MVSIAHHGNLKHVNGLVRKIYSNITVNPLQPLTLAELEFLLYSNYLHQQHTSTNSKHGNPEFYCHSVLLYDFITDDDTLS